MKLRNYRPTNERLIFTNPDFEYDVRDKLNIPSRPIYEEDVQKITELDGSNYRYPFNDKEALSKFVNLERLDIGIGGDLDFLSSFPHLKYLYLEYGNYFDILNFTAFNPLKELEYLFITGGMLSYMHFENVEILTGLKKLTALSFHEFGSVDLKFLEEMPQMKHFFCGYADEVKNADAIGSLVNLESLDLTCVEMQNLKFLDNLPDAMSLTLCADNVIEGFNLSDLARFKELDVSEMVSMPSNKWSKNL